METINLVLVGFILVIVGFVLMIVGSLLQTKTRVESGGVILIGPFPIIWGTNRSIVLLSGIVAIMFLLMLILFYLIGR